MEFKCIACDGKMIQVPEMSVYSCSNPACAMQRLTGEQVQRIEAFRVKMMPKAAAPIAETKAKK